MARAKPVKAAAEPSVVFFHSQDLRERTLAVLDAIDADDAPERHREALAEIVVELTETGLTYFYLGPLELAKAGFLSRQSASFGLTGALTVIAPMVRNILGRLDGEQIQVIADFVRKHLR